ncbi:DUF1186 domain-containing protein [Paenibacillus riograndensis]|uniref:DUF1186 domain-containing protein n=1 Tax=Paenibacillus riograndensis SBR5 TaxID=1073571 RepID=A0A0E4H702_9BACL|nr:DUF1186 domain-containing protein [Paenibacillus riograndensis]CQR52747.1 hypothetical protein PRIO_0988 [Paenibacillus riograndensis SBR5]
MQHLLDSIKYNKDRRFPREELEEIISRKEEAIPHLLEIMRELQAHPQLAEDPARLDFMYSAYLLSQFRVTALFPILVELFSLPEELLDMIFDDILTDAGGRMLASVYDGDLSLLKRLIENGEASEYARGQGLRALTILVYEGQILRETAISYVKELLTSKRVDSDYYFYAEIVCDAVDLYPEEVYADIEKLYEDEALDPYVILLDEVKATLQMSQAEAMQRKSTQESYQYINDIHAEMENWVCFQPESSGKIEMLREIGG